MRLHLAVIWELRLVQASMMWSVEWMLSLASSTYLEHQDTSPHFWTATCTYLEELKAHALTPFSSQLCELDLLSRSLVGLLTSL